MGRAPSSPVGTGSFDPSLRFARSRRYDLEVSEMFGAGIPPAVPDVAGNGPEGLIVLSILVLVAACAAIAVLIHRRGERAKVTTLALRPEERKAA